MVFTFSVKSPNTFIPSDIYESDGQERKKIDALQLTTENAKNVIGKLTAGNEVSFFPGF
jgi:hypothetical protein